MPIFLPQPNIKSDGGALLPDGFCYIYEHFTQGPCASATDDAASFDLVGTSAGLTLSDADNGGVGVLLSNSTNPALLMQNGEPVSLAANRTIYWEARINLADADGMNFFAGLCITDTNVFSTSLTDYVGFFALSGNSGSINVGCGKDNDNIPGSGTTGETDADIGNDAADNTWMRLKFIIDGVTQVRFWCDNGTDTKSYTISTDLPDNEQLAVGIETVGNAETIDIDYVYGYQTTYQ